MSTDHVSARACFDKCATSDVCRLKGCREVRLAEIREEAALQARLEAVSLAPPVMKFDKDSLIRIDSKIMIKRCPEPGVTAAGTYEVPEYSWPSLADHLVLDSFTRISPALPDSSYADAIIAKYSTPGLKKNELSRSAKKEQLNSHGMSKFPEERDKILDQLYPEGK